jgi:hypothetical protein
MLNGFNMLNVDVTLKGCGGIGTGICAAISQGMYWVLTIICKILGLFADLLNIAFYIFAGVDINSTTIGDSSSNIYDITVGDQKKNILDYFLFSEVMQKAYWALVAIGLVAILIFTIYKIVKQDYFDKSGPRSKGPIFRNVAISCISFLLVIPIFYLIVHVSALLAIVVMDAMGMDSSVFAGAKIFQLSWSDNGKAMLWINNKLRGLSTNESTQLKWLWDLNEQTLFAGLADGDYVSYDTAITSKITNITNWSGNQLVNLIVLDDGKASNANGDVNFYWYIDIVGTIVAIKALKQLIFAMIQRVFKLMGLFLVAPSPISQYVLDDGAKFKSWMSQSIQEGLRVVVATMSFAIYLIALNLIGDIDFISAFTNAISASSVSEGSTTAQLSANVSTSLLVYNGEITRSSITMLEDSAITTAFQSLVNAFMKICLIMGAGGAITDLDAVLTPLISGGKTSLDSGEVGKAVSAPINATEGLINRGVATAMGAARVGIGAAAGAIGGLGHGLHNSIAQYDERSENDGNPPAPDGGGDNNDPNAPVSSPGGAPTSTAGGGNNGSDTPANSPEEAPASTAAGGGNDPNTPANSPEEAPVNNDGTTSKPSEDNTAAADQQSNVQEAANKTEETRNQTNNIVNKPQKKLFHRIRKGLLGAGSALGIAVKTVGLAGKVAGAVGRQLNLTKFFREFMGIPKEMAEDYDKTRDRIAKDRSKKDKNGDPMSRGKLIHDAMVHRAGEGGTKLGNFVYDKTHQSTPTTSAASAPPENHNQTNTNQNHNQVATDQNSQDQKTPLEQVSNEDETQRQMQKKSDLEFRHKTLQAYINSGEGKTGCSIKKMESELGRKLTPQEKAVISDCGLNKPGMTGAGKKEIAEQEFEKSKAELEKYN